MDTINRYLDDTLTQTELDELGETLLRDRELAASFARATRLDHSLEESFTEIASEAEFGEMIALLEQSQAPPRPIRRVAVACAAAAVVIATGVAIIQFWPGSRMTSDPTEAESRPTTKRIQRPSVHLPQTRLTAILPRESHTDAEAEAFLRQRLSRFYLPATSIRDLPLDEALASIQQSLHTIDQFGWTAVEPVELGLAGDRTSSDPPPIVSLNRSNISVLNALNLLAMQSGHELAFSPSKITLGAIKKAEPNTENNTEALVRNYGIPIGVLEGGPYDEPLHAIFSPDGLMVATTGEADIVRIWNAENGELVQTLEHPSRSEISTPRFSADGERLLLAGGDEAKDITIQILSPDWDSIRGTLRSTWGLDVADSDEGSYLSDSNQLVLTASPADHARFSALLSEANGTSSSSSPVTIATKLISLPDGLAGTTDQIVNAEEWQHIIRDWRAQPGVDLMTAPTITAHIGTEVSAEIITTRFVEVNQEPGENFGEIAVDQSTGLRLPFTTSAAGEQITIRGSIEQSLSEDSLSPEMLEQLGGSDPDSPIVHFNTEVEAPLYPGQVALFECESHEPGRTLIAAVGVTWVAPSTAPPQAPEPSPNQ